MAPSEWHVRSSQSLLNLAQQYLKAEDYPAAAEAALRGLEEVIDARTAVEDLHFHDDYPSEAWTKRLEWIRDRAPVFENMLQRFIEALVAACAGRDFQSIKEDVAELERLVGELSTLPNKS